MLSNKMKFLNIFQAVIGKFTEKFVCKHTLSSAASS